jgi:hypothetical protein
MAQPQIAMSGRMAINARMEFLIEIREFVHEAIVIAARR